MSANPGGSRGQQASGALVNYASSPTDLDPPTDVYAETYSGGKWAYGWVNSEPTQTQYSLNGGTTVEGTFAQGVAYWASGSAVYQSGFAVRHINQTKQSAWATLVEL